MGFTDMLTPIISAFQQSGAAGAEGAGRPVKKTGSLTESGEQTRADGENIAKKK
jgi:hypothetical protein